MPEKEYRVHYRSVNGERDWFGSWWPWKWESVLVHVAENRGQHYSDRAIEVEVRDA